jgi:glycosyltransferase involved in cell wall biosynthesis
MRKAATNSSSIGAVAYVLKGFPRLSEIFIASEILRMEANGVPIRLMVIKAADETVHHAVVEEISAPPEYLPHAGSVSRTPFLTWLRANLPRFLPSVRRMIRRRPLGVLRAAAAAAAQAIRARGRFVAWPRKVYAKELLQAIALADRLLEPPVVRHLHAHFCHGATTVTWLASLITGLPFSFTAHAKDIYCESLNPAGLLARKMRAARMVVTCTDANRVHLTRLATGTPIHRIYHGLNTDFMRLLGEVSCESPHPSPGAILRILAVGRLVAKKGLDVLVDACAILVQRGVALHLDIVGEPGDQSKELAARVSRRGLLDAVSIRGPMTQAALVEQYRSASVFCLPCRVADDGDRDGIPNVLLEAMACGLPVVTTPVSGIPELLANNINGLLVPTDDPDATADALQRLHADAPLAARLAAAGRADVQTRFCGDRMAIELAGLFGAVMS